MVKKTFKNWKEISASTPHAEGFLLNQTNKKDHYCGIMHNETLIKVGKSKKTLNITNIGWGGQSIIVWTLQGTMQMLSLDLM
jgi:hypothetical protein